MNPILDTYKKKVIENLIVDKILEMIAKADTDRLDFGLKTITRDHSHVVFTNETKYQNYEPRDPDSKTKIIYSRTPLARTLKGSENLFELAGFSSYRGSSYPGKND